MPPIVKTYLALCVLAAALVQTQRLSPATLALSPRALPPDLELWRPVTALCYGDGFTPSWLLKVLLISHYGSQLEAAAAATRGAVWPLLNAWFMLGWLLIGAGFMLAAAAARPSELLQPFLLTPTVFFLGTLCSFLPRPGSTRLPIDLTPWAGLAALALVAGPASALRSSAGVGAAVAVHLAEVLPTSAADGAEPFRRLPRGGARRASVAAALTASLLLGAAGVDLSSPPMSHSSLLRAQAAALSGALEIDPQAEFFGALSNSSNVSVVMAGRRGNTSAPASSGLAPTQLLRVYQHCADFWSTQHHRARLFNTVRQKRGGAALTSNEQLLAELERDLAEVLSQVDFKAEPNDEQVLKTSLRELPRPELQSLMPRPKMLETVAAHRESHVAAHDALSQLSLAIEAYVQAVAAGRALPAGGGGELPAGGGGAIPAGEGGVRVGGAAAAGDGGSDQPSRVAVTADGSMDSLGGGAQAAPGSTHSSAEAAPAATAAAAGAATVAAAGAGDKTGAEASLFRASDGPGDAISERGAISAGDVASLQASVTEQLKTTLWAFSVPLEMSDGEVLAELMPVGLAVGAGTRAELLADVHALRTQLRDESIARSVDDLRQRIALPSALPPVDVSSATPAVSTSGSASVSSGVAGQVGGGRGSLTLNETARIESTSLALELLTFHEADAGMGEHKMVAELLSLANLTANQTREGAMAAMAEAALSWRLLSSAQGAVAALRSLFLRGLVAPDQADQPTAPGKGGAAATTSDGPGAVAEVTAQQAEGEEVQEVPSAAEAGTAANDDDAAAEAEAAAIEEAAAGAAAAGAALTDLDAEDDRGASSDRTGPVSWAEHASIPALVETAMLGYEFPPLMSTEDVVAYLLKLMKMEQYNLPVSFGPRAWLENAVVAARAKGVQAAASAAPASAAGAAAAGPPPPPLLLPQLAGTSAAALIGGAATAVSDDHFALLVAAVMQAVGVHTRLSICCDPPLAADVGAGPAAGGGNDQPGEPACHLAAEVRVGKSPQRLNRWIAQHRKAQRALRKSVRGAVDIHFRRDHLGFLWLPLRWRPGAAEQLPGAPGANASFCMMYYDAGSYFVEGAPLDSRGMTIGREKNEKVLCTL